MENRYTLAAPSAPSEPSAPPEISFGVDLPALKAGIVNLREQQQAAADRRDLAAEVVLKTQGAIEVLTKMAADLEQKTFEAVAAANQAQVAAASK